MSVLLQIKQNVIDGNAPGAQSSVKQAMSAGIPAEQILNEGLIAAMRQVGKLFEEGEYFVPEMLIAARAMKGGLELVRPALAAANIQAIGKIVVGTVQGDLHDIGKNLVAMMMEGAGFEVIDLGVDVTPEKFVEVVKTHQPNLIGCSALLTTTMPKMKATIDALQEAGLRNQVKVLVGGAPVTAKYASEIGADAYAPDASAAANIAKSLLLK
ncbi:MAG: cobalamin-binding protein [Chloroflexi bacterium]|nr:cobalamin-binding protein [Chloroflexota bacterium]